MRWPFWKCAKYWLLFGFSRDVTDFDRHIFRLASEILALPIKILPKKCLDFLASVVLFSSGSCVTQMLTHSWIVAPIIRIYFFQHVWTILPCDGARRTSLSIVTTLNRLLLTRSTRFAPTRLPFDTQIAQKSEKLNTHVRQGKNGVVFASPLSPSTSVARPARAGSNSAG